LWTADFIWSVYFPWLPRLQSWEIDQYYYSQTTYALLTRKKSPLSNPEWKTVPWSEIPKTPKDLLIDIFVEMPTLLEDLDRIRECLDPPSQRHLRRELVRKCWAHATELVDWRARLGIADPIYNGDADPPPFSLDLLAVSHLLCLNWSICLTVYSTLRIASGFQTILPKHTELRPYARKIAEALSVLLHPDSGADGVHVGSYPAAAALTYLNFADGATPSEEKRRILDAFRRSAHGITVDRFITSMQRQGMRAPQVATVGGPDAA
jgi:hypothetical protein